jgi:hypothetical protein
MTIWSSKLLFAFCTGLLKLHIVSRLSRFYFFFLSLTSKFQVLHDICAQYKCLIIQINPKVNLHWLRLGDLNCQQISPSLPIHVRIKHLIKLVQKMCPKMGATSATWKMWLGFSSMWGITHVSGICKKAELVMVYLWGRRDQTLILHYSTHSLSGCCTHSQYVHLVLMSSRFTTCVDPFVFMLWKLFH